MTQTEVTYLNWHSQSWQNIFDVINNRSYVPDPLSTSGQLRKWVYTRKPNVTAKDFSGYPFIVVYNSQVDFSDDGASTNGQVQDIDFTISLEIYTSDDARNNDNLKGAQVMDTITNNIVTTLNNNAVRMTLYNLGMKRVRVHPEPVLPGPLASTMTYKRPITITAMTRKKVY